MAINKNHECEELNGVKCSIVERNCTSKRIVFLKTLLEINGFEVHVAETSQAMATAKATPDDGVQQPAEVEEQKPDPTFTVGVTDLTFNTTNALFGRLLKTQDGHAVTLNYWNQKSDKSYDDIPYYAI